VADHFKKPGHSSAPEPSLRQSESYVALGTAVLINPFIDALVAFIVICQMAISLVADELFIEFLQVIFPKIKDILPGCGKSMRGYIIKAYEQRKVKVKDILARSKSKIHFSFDLWTSPNHLALIGIIAHFVDDHGRNQSVSCSYPRVLLLLANISSATPRIFTRDPTCESAQLTPGFQTAYPV
jgi:hypothetical protein